MRVSTMNKNELARLLRTFRNVLLKVIRPLVGPAKMAAGAAAAKLDKLAGDAVIGRKTRAVIDAEFSKILLSLAQNQADVFAALLGEVPELPEFDNPPKPEPEHEEPAEETDLEEPEERDQE